MQYYDIDGLVQERRNSSALAMELRLSCTNPSKYSQSGLFPGTVGDERYQAKKFVRVNALGGNQEIVTL